MAIDLTLFNDAILSPFGESITYVPRSGPERPITANVNRDSLSVIQGMENAVGLQFTVHVKNHATEGIAGAEIDEGGDSVKIAEFPGGTPVIRKIKYIIDVDTAMISFVAR